LRRQADAALDGRFARPLEAAMVLGSGIGILAAQLLGGLARVTSRRAVEFVAVLGLAILVAHHAVMRDDYPNVHAGLTWAGATLFGSALARPARLRLESRPRALHAIFLAAALGTILEPSNALRLELFRECGAVAPWVLAKTVWRLPRLAERAAPPPDRPQLVAKEGRESPAPSRLVPAPVVVLVTVDALRADVLAAREHERQLPNLTKIKKTGFYVPRAVSAGSQTSVSLAAMFSGRPYSGQRWTLHGEGAARFLYPATDRAPRVPTLLAEAGVRSEGFFALRFLTGDFGITRGFGVEHLLTEGRRHAPAHAVMTPLLARLDRVRPDESLLLYVHLTEPHEPYDRGRLREGTSFQRYLSEVEVVDGWIGKLLAKLNERAPGRGYVLVSADHGEAFGEHGTTFHTKTLYDELLRVPLIVWGPKIRARRCDGLASLIDIGATVLDMFGVPRDPSSMGETLLPLALAERACDARRLPIVAEGRLRRALYTSNGLKVIEDHVHKTVEVFDLERDPGELTNLFPDDPRSRRALAELRATFEARAHPGYEPPYKP
jgi:arylsulfatase A-like enzyme